MNKDINLIRGKKKNFVEKEARVRIVRLVAIFSLVFIVGSAIVIFLINQFSGIQESLQKERNATQNISFFKNKIGKFLLVQSRLKDIYSIYAQDSHIDTTINELQDGLPADVRIDSLSVTRIDVTMTVISSNLSSINDFLDFIINKVNNKQLFKKLTVDNVIADTKLQKYTLSIEGQLL